MDDLFGPAHPGGYSTFAEAMDRAVEESVEDYQELRKRRGVYVLANAAAMLGQAIAATMRDNPERKTTFAREWQKAGAIGAGAYARAVGGSDPGAACAVLMESIEILERMGREDPDA